MVSRINNLVGSFGFSNLEDNTDTKTAVESLTKEITPFSTFEKITDLQTAGALLKSKISASANMPRQQADPAETHWASITHNRRITVTKEDYAKADEILHQKHPELNGQKNEQEIIK